MKIYVYSSYTVFSEHTYCKHFLKTKIYDINLITIKNDN